MLSIPDIAIGAVLAASITGVISFLGLVISKEQKTSEFRQAWIDALRASLSSFVTHVIAIHGAQVAGLGDRAAHWKAARDDYVGINVAAADIRLRLNPDEADSRAILLTIERIEALLMPGEPTRSDEFDQVLEQLMGQARLVLKAEWRRVQRGERVFQVATGLATVLAAASILGAGVLTWKAAAAEPVEGSFLPPTRSGTGEQVTRAP